MEWHMIIDGNGNKPAKDEIVVGYWMSGPESFACLCYYDEDTDEWTSTDNGESISEPDYWIETP